MHKIMNVLTRIAKNNGLRIVAFMVTQTQQQHLNQRFHSLCEDAIKIKRTKEQ